MSESKRVQNRVQELLAKKGRIEERTISLRTAASETGVALNTIHAWSRNRVQRYDAEQIIVFCDYFECEIADLLVRG